MNLPELMRSMVNHPTAPQEEKKGAEFQVVSFRNEVVPKVKKVKLTKEEEGLIEKYIGSKKEKAKKIPVSMGGFAELNDASIRIWFHCFSHKVELKRYSKKVPIEALIQLKEFEEHLKGNPELKMEKVFVRYDKHQNKGAMLIVKVEKGYHSSYFPIVRWSKAPMSFDAVCNFAKASYRESRSFYMQKVLIAAQKSLNELDLETDGFFTGLHLNSCTPEIHSNFSKEMY